MPARITKLNGGRCVTRAHWILLGLFAVSALNSYTIAANVHTKASGWKVVRGSNTDWKILANRLECTFVQPGSHWILSKSPVNGDYVIQATFKPGFSDGDGVIFSAKADLSYGYMLAIGDKVSLYRFSGDNQKLVTAWPLADHATDAVRIVKKGTTYRIELGGRVLNTITNPGGDRTAKPQPPEPDGGHWGFALSKEGSYALSDLRGFSIPRADFLTTNPVVEVGPKGSWDQSAEAFASAVLQDQGKFYLYYSADYDHPPNGIQEEPLHRIGVAISSDLKNWKKYDKNPILGASMDENFMKFFDLPASYVFATMQGGGGVVRLPDGQFGLTFNVLGWNGKGQWLGIWLAEAPSPLGPFHKVQPGPILTFGGPTDFDGATMHLHGVQQLADGSYAMLYTGYNSKIATGKPGDRGGLATSKDMIHWTKYEGNPVFVPGERGSWDDEHVRPKTFVRLKDWYYMFYEGAHFSQGGWPEWPDQVGLARSRDLIHWERYPYNPLISTTTVGQSGDVAQIQPAAIVVRDKLYVFYGCLDSGKPFAVCGAQIPSKLLDSWGGE